MAFVFLNRYIDLADAIDEGSYELMDSPYLAETDIPLENTNLNEPRYLSVRKLFTLFRYTFCFLIRKKFNFSERKTRRN